MKFIDLDEKIIEERGGMDRIRVATDIGKPAEGIELCLAKDYILRSSQWGVKSLLTPTVDEGQGSSRKQMQAIGLEARVPSSSS